MNSTESLVVVALLAALVQAARARERHVAQFVALGWAAQALAPHQLPEIPADRTFPRRWMQQHQTCSPWSLALVLLERSQVRTEPPNISNRSAAIV